MGRSARPVSVRHVLEQGPMLMTMGSVALSMLKPAKSSPSRVEPAAVPGPWFEDTVKPRSDDLIRDYVRHVGGDPSWYRGQVPAHLAPQWTLHLAAKTLAGLPYPVPRAINAGCRLEMKAPLPSGEPLIVRGRLESIDEDENRALVTHRFVTGTRSVAEAVILELRVFIPLATKSDGARREKAPSTGRLTAKQVRLPTELRELAARCAGLRPLFPAKPSGIATKRAPVVPAGAREIAFFKLSSHAGLDFAKLTGDFNPVHWVPAYARAAGFRSAILHGFATVARSIEALNRTLFAGDPSALRSLDARFTRPLVLPGEVGVYVTPERGLYVGDAPGGGAYLEGHFETRLHGGAGAPSP